MGYMLSALGNLPVEDDVSLYIFVISGGWEGGRDELIERNFSKIAQRIGPNAVIARGFNETEWTGEIARTYLGQDADELWQLLPALLLTDAHPGSLTDGSLRLLIPLRDAEERFGGLDVFFRALSDFAVDRDPAFLERFHDRTDLVEAGNSVVDLKPNFFGLGINLNELIRRFRGR